MLLKEIFLVKLWAAYYTQNIGRVYVFSPSSFPFLSLTPHTSGKLLAKRPAFLIALNYRDVGFFSPSYFYMLDHRRQLVEQVFLIGICDY